MKDFIDKYSHWIIGLLFILFCMKSCQSCSVERGRKWDEVVHTQQIDSMHHIQDSLNTVISIQRDSIINCIYTIHQLEHQVNRSEEILKRTENINNYLKRSNQRLIDYRATQSDK